jgi:hypothetical protein
MADAKRLFLETETLASNIVTCEDCFSIPKIILLNRNKIEIECSKCNSMKYKDANYLIAFLKKINENKELPKCNYNEKHESKSVKYCCQCTKYLCEECIKIHDISFVEKSHILIAQKMQSQYYCNQKGHKEFIYRCYCTECKKYLCSECKCEHSEDKLYLFDDKENKGKINEIIKKVSECEKIIENEEKKLNDFTYPQQHLTNIKKNAIKISSIKDENSCEKIKNISFNERSEYASKLEMVPQNIELKIINCDKTSFSKSNSNKFLFNYPKENSFFNRAKGRGIKEINFNLFEYYCFGKCFNNKSKKIELFHKGCLLYRDEMDIFHIFRHLLDMEKTVVEKNCLKEDMKIFSQQTFI